MIYPNIPDQFQAKAVIEEAKRFIDPTAPTSMLVNPTNYGAFTQAWASRSARNSKAIIGHLRRRKLPKEMVDKAGLMLKAVTAITKTEYRIFAAADDRAKILYMHRLVAIRIGYDYFAKHPETIASELLNQDRPPQATGETGVLAYIGTPMIDIPKEEIETNLIHIPAPIILTWQGTINTLIMADEQPCMKDTYLNLSAAWNRLGGNLCQYGE